MKKLIFISMLVIAFAISMFTSSCTSVNVDGGEVAVLTDKPWFFGKGGIRQESWGPGLQYTWISTDYVKYKTIPIVYEEHFDNIITSDNNPVAFSVYIKISVLGDSAWYLHREFLADWYKNNISPKFRTAVRDKSCPYQMFDLTTKREISIKIENELKDNMISYVKSKKLPIIIDEVNVGSVQPQEAVLAEIANTAAKTQNKKTQIAEAEAQIERKKAEEQRAIADQAYMNKMGLSTQQFVTLEVAKTYQNIAETTESTFLIGNIPNITVSSPTK